VSTAGREAPAWLLRPEPGLCSCGCVGRRRRGSFLDKTLRGTTVALARVLFDDDEAERDLPLQRVDPAVKIVAAALLLLAAALVHHVVVLVALSLALLGLAAGCGVPAGRLARRVWFTVPAFTAVVVVPATFSFVTPGEVVLPLGTWFGHPVGLTRQGLTAALLLVARVGACLTVALSLTMTTRWDRLLGGARRLGVPRAIVMVASMAFRYLCTLLETVTDLFTARKARTVNPSDATEGRRFVAASAGTVFGASHHLATEVHEAMIARGYTGEPRTLARARVRRVDALWFLGALAAATLALGVDRVVLG